MGCLLEDRDWLVDGSLMQIRGRCYTEWFVDWQAAVEYYD